MPAVLANITYALGMLAKSVERSRTLQGPIKRDLWDSYTQLTAGLSSLLGRKERSGPTATKKSGSPTALEVARVEWRRECEKLSAEIERLRNKNAWLEAASHPKEGMIRTRMSWCWKLRPTPRFG